MAEPRTLEDLSSEERGEDDQEEEELENLEKLEAEVKQMAQRILEYRTTLPDQFKSTLSSILVSQRPILPHFDIAAEPGISGDRTPDGGEHVQLSQDALLAEKDPETAEKIRGTIHPAFKRRKS
ncbi:PREDICTED: uncharacterized protein LOC104596064 isoform X2 [Nelumbo nucifera]|uniref:Uncharacterized protein n=2 Tax=Nelumbo nucifera TaxID=4432 RepID=A0A822XIF6_NELNU|nr:PREDICTED: uncharacterized protein LOC104596064 isoform X2 [Nelumbo nucifera]DAD18921.1 TPA_asm: hypothetical protein HUJ06_020384 [Nelumbo nucifera]